jgi:transposase InsO family protein
MLLLYLTDRLHEKRKYLRRDNRKQFNCHLMAKFFRENKMHQVFTHPYTPEENGHVESFHAILTTALKKDRLIDLPDLKKRLRKFHMLQ